MAGLARRLRTVTTLKPLLFPKPETSLITHHNHHLGPPKSENADHPVFNLVPFTLDKVEYQHPLPIFTSSPFGYCLNPILPIGSDQLGLSGADDDDDRTIWADSVKKKRKRKMNKHKLRKLRKNLRRKT